MNLQSFLLGMVAGALLWSAVVVNRARTFAEETRQNVDELLDGLFPFLF